MVAAGAGFGVVAIGQGNAVAAAATCFFLAVILFFLGRNEKKKEKARDWLEKFRTQFERHIPDFCAVMDMTWKRDPDGGKPEPQWTTVAKGSDWAFSFQEAAGANDSSRRLLGFAKEVYPPNAVGIVALKEESIIPSDEFRQFHYGTRRALAAYLQGAGWSKEKDFIEWRDTELVKRIGEHIGVVRMVVYLSMPLRSHTLNDPTGDLKDCGLDWCQEIVVPTSSRSFIQ